MSTGTVYVAGVARLQALKPVAGIARFQAMKRRHWRRHNNGPPMPLSVFGPRRTAPVRKLRHGAVGQRQRRLLLVLALVMGMMGSCWLPTSANGWQGGSEIKSGAQTETDCGCSARTDGHAGLKSSVALVKATVAAASADLFISPQEESDTQLQQSRQQQSDPDELEYTKDGLRFLRVQRRVQAGQSTGQPSGDQQGSQRRSGTRQIGVPGGGGGGGGGGSDPCQGHITRVVGVTATGETTVKVDYELGENYPTANCPYDNPHYVVFRRIDSRPGVGGFGEEIERRRLSGSQLECGSHSIDVDLRHIGGQYHIVFVLGPTCFNNFYGAFTMENGLADWDGLYPFFEGFPVGQAAPVKPTECTAPLESGSQGDSAVPFDIIPKIGMTLDGGTGGAGGCVTCPDTTASGCGPCGSGGGAADPGNGSTSFRTVSFDIQLLPNLAYRQSSLGLGGFLPFDSSIHAMRVNDSDRVEFRLTDATTGQTVHFTPDPDEEGIYRDENDLYRYAELAGGSLSASDIVVTRHTGETMRFELFNLDDDTDNVNDRDGRLTEWRDRNGRGYDITYQGNTSFRIGQVTDAHGRQYAFNYSGKQAGRDALSMISMPDGSQVSFNYNQHVLGGVSVTPLGSSTPTWQWTNAVSGIQGNGPVRMEIDSPTTGKRIWRFQNGFFNPNVDYSSNPYSAVASIHAPGDADSIVMNHVDNNDSGRMLMLGENEFTVSEFQNGVYYRSAIDYAHNPSEPDPMQAYTPQWPAHYDRNVWLPPVASGAGNSGNNQNGSNQNGGNQNGNNQNRAANFVAPTNELITGSPPIRETYHGESIDLHYDENRFLTRRTYHDGTFETWARNTDKQVTRYRDRLGRVTEMLYDGNGNMTEQRVGLMAGNGGPDTQVPGQYAVYRYDYYPDGLLKTAFSPLHSGQSDMYRTDYVYYSSAPNKGRLRQVIQSADVAGGARPVTQYTWNAAGRMTSMTDPVGRTTSYAYDGLGRVVQTTYNDGSTEQVAYLPGTDAGQVQATKDRNNVVTVNTWDQRARLVQSVTAAAIDANILDGNAMDQVISDPTQQRITTRQFYDGLEPVSKLRFD